MTTLHIADIRIDGGTQQRAAINWTAVAEYAADMANGDVFPPVVVFYDGANYWLSSGFHRYHAVTQLGLAAIQAEIRSGTLQDAVDYACSKEPNGKNGMRETKDDRDNRIDTMLQQHPDWSSRRIAEHCGVTHPTVENRRGLIWKDLPDNNERTVFRGESTYTMTTQRREVETPEPPTMPVVWPVAPELETDYSEDELPNGCHNCVFLQTHGEDWWCTKRQRPTYVEYAICDMKDWQAENTPKPETETEPEAPAPVPHVAYNSGNNEWYTPAEYIEAARAVLGEIELDPSSTEVANTVVCANEFYTAEQDGLRYHWSGRVWMNPPYASELIGKFCEKLANHVADGDVSEAIALVNNGTETGWFNTLISNASAVCFPRGRVRFWSPVRESATPLQGQAVVYFGPNPDRFRTEFAHIGWSAAL